VVVAASGGADSAAALLLAREAMPAAQLVAVYIDHGLRPRAAIAADIAAVRAQARHARATVVVGRVRAAKRGASPEAAAREARYRELVRIAHRLRATAIVTGHHRDDVSETALLALVRGSGLDGLAAMPRRRALAPGIMLMRPLLDYSKTQLREFIRACGVPFATDETNADVRLRRNAVRALLIELERIAPGAGKAIARSAALLAADRSTLDALARAAWEEARIVGSDGELSVAALRRLEPPLLRRVIRHAVKDGAGTLRDFHLEHCEAIAAAIGAGRGGTFHAGRASVELSAGRLTVHAKKPRSGRIHSTGDELGTSTIAVPKGRAISTDTSGRMRMQRIARAKAPKRAMLLDESALSPGMRLTVRAPREGDTCVPSGRSRLTSLARFLAKAGVPRHRRASVPLLCLGKRIVAAIGVRVMEPFGARGDRALAVLWGGSH